MNVTQIVDWLKTQNISEIAENTGVPRDRMYKWTKGKGTPKAEDYNKLLKYYNDTNGINSKKEISITIEGTNELSILKKAWEKLKSDIALGKDDALAKENRQLIDDIITKLKDSTEEMRKRTDKN